MSSEAAEGDQAVPAPFRYSVSPVAGEKTHCLRPNKFEPQDTMNVKHQILGQAFANNYHKLCQNKRASVVWEAGKTPLCHVMSYHDLGWVCSHKEIRP